MQPNIIILLAEDEYLVGVSFQDVLEDGGYSVRHVSSGLEAIGVLEEDGCAVSGVITDIRLGEGPDGWEVARRAGD